MLTLLLKITTRTGSYSATERKESIITSLIINNSLTFVNEKCIIHEKIIILQIYFINSNNFIAIKAMPAPINGPTATPLNKETERIVPRTNAVVM